MAQHSRQAVKTEPERIQEIFAQAMESRLAHALFVALSPSSDRAVVSLLRDAVADEELAAALERT